MTGRQGLFARLRRAFSSTDGLAANRDPALEDCAEEIAAVCGAGLRTRVRVSGRVEETRTIRRGGTAWFEVVVSDGSGTVLLVWVGRSAIPGIDRGGAISASGRLAERDGRLIIHNPRYELR